jgi:hypothetical protein
MSSLVNHVDEDCPRSTSSSSGGDLQEETLRKQQNAAIRPWLYFAGILFLMLCIIQLSVNSTAFRKISNEESNSGVMIMEEQVSHTNGSMTMEFDTSKGRFVIPKELSKQLCTQKIDEWKEKASTLVSNLPIARPIPVKTRPFVYFHTRKAGGSSLRSIINDMAKRAGIKSSWIPCENRGCVPFSLPGPDKDFAVYAGHLNFMHMTNLMRETKLKNILLQQTGRVTLENGKNITYHSLDDSYDLFDCITTIRPTVKRVVSCWNFRFNKQTNPRSPGFPLPRTSQLDPQDFAKLLPKAYDQYGNGCNNEMARIFGSTVDETYVNTLSPSDPRFIQELESVASRMSKCLILRVDRCKDSNAIIHHFIPWMNGTDVCSSHKNVHGKPSDEVTEKAKSVILEQNYFDELIFTLGEELFEKQLEKATNTSVNAP